MRIKRQGQRVYTPSESVTLQVFSRFRAYVGGRYVILNEAVPVAMKRRRLLKSAIAHIKEVVSQDASLCIPTWISGGYCNNTLIRPVGQV